MKHYQLMTVAFVLVFSISLFAQEISDEAISATDTKTVEPSQQKEKETELSEDHRIRLTFEAIRSGDIDMFNKYWFPAMAYKFDKNGENMLTLAIKSGHAAMVKLVETHSIINRKNEEGETPLTLAIKSRNPAIVDVIVKRAKAALRNNFGETPIFLALEYYDQIDFLQELISKGADLNARSNGITPLYRAVELNKLPVIALFIKNGADPSVPNHDGQIPLTVAVSQNAESIAGMLLFKSHQPEEDANWSNHLGEPIIVLAASNGQSNLIRTLISYGADPNAADYMGNTALTMAAISGNAPMIQYLVNSGADLNHQNMLGVTPIVAAAESGHYATANFLAANGANLNTRSFSGVAATDFYSFTTPAATSKEVDNP